MKLLSHSYSSYPLVLGRYHYHPLLLFFGKDADMLTCVTRVTFTPFHLSLYVARSFILANDNSTGVGGVIKRADWEMPAIMPKSLCVCRALSALALNWASLKERLSALGWEAVT
jgi:hypothetical protein